MSCWNGSDILDVGFILESFRRIIIFGFLALASTNNSYSTEHSTKHFSSDGTSSRNAIHSSRAEPRPIQRRSICCGLRSASDSLWLGKQPLLCSFAASVCPSGCRVSCRPKNRIPSRRIVFFKFVNYTLRESEKQAKCKHLCVSWYRQGSTEFYNSISSGAVKSIFIHQWINK